MAGRVQLVNNSLAMSNFFSFPRQTQLATYAADGPSESNGDSKRWNGFLVYTGSEHKANDNIEKRRVP